MKMVDKSWLTLMILDSIVFTWLGCSVDQTNEKVFASMHSTSWLLHCTAAGWSSRIMSDIHLTSINLFITLHQCSQMIRLSLQLPSMSIGKSGSNEFFLTRMTVNLTDLPLTNEQPLSTSTLFARGRRWDRTCERATGRFLGIEQLSFKKTEFRSLLYITGLSFGSLKNTGSTFATIWSEIFSRCGALFDGCYDQRLVYTTTTEQGYAPSLHIVLPVMDSNTHYSIALRARPLPPWDHGAYTFQKDAFLKWFPIIYLESDNGNLGSVKWAGAWGVYCPGVGTTRMSFHGWNAYLTKVSTIFVEGFLHFVESLALLFTWHHACI